MDPNYYFIIFPILALLQSPVSSVASVNERTPAQSSRRRLFSGPQEAVCSPSAGSVQSSITDNNIRLPLESESVDQKVELQPSPNPNMLVTTDNKPKRTGSLSLFFRKVSD